MSTETIWQLAVYATAMTSGLAGVWVLTPTTNEWRRRRWPVSAFVHTEWTVNGLAGTSAAAAPWRSALADVQHRLAVQEAECESKRLRLEQSERQLTVARWRLWVGTGLVVLGIVLGAGGDGLSLWLG